MMGLSYLIGINCLNKPSPRIVVVLLHRRAMTQNAILRSTDGAPWHGNQDPALHRLNKGHRSMNRISPAFNTPGLFTTNLAFLQVGELPEMVHRVEIANLHKPSTDAFHDLATSL